MRFLIAGLGSIGRRHLRNLLALGQRDIVLYRTFQSTLPDDDLADFPTVTRLEDGLAMKPDAVIVANPTALHMEVAVPAAEAGCAILLEKPIAHTLEAARPLQEAVRRTGARVLVGFQFRFHPTLRRVKTWLAEGRIGRPLYFRAHWGEYLPDWHPWEDYRQSYAARADLGGGVIRTLSHPLDYARYLLGDGEVVWALADHISDLELQGVEDLGEIGLRFANGAVGAVHVDYFQRPPAHWVEILGTEGTIAWNYYTGKVVWKPARGQGEEVALPEGWERNHMFLEEMRHFLDVVQGQAEPICTLEDGLENMRWVEEALRLAKRKS